MNSCSFTFIVFLPLVVFLVFVIIYEYKTGLIKDKHIFPAATCLIPLAMHYGRHPWWHYPLGGIVTLILLVAGAHLAIKLIHEETWGGGAIKLMAVVCGVMGIQAGLVIGAIVIGAVTVIHFAFYKTVGANETPSSPLILFGTVLSYILIGQ